MKKKILRSLVMHRLENVSKAVFKKYYSLITELVGSSPDIYALYDDTELYYVGKSTDLRKRVKHHLRDRHFANWTHFSLYLVRRADHIGEIESLLIRIADPKGNRIRPSGKASSTMLGKLKLMIKEKQKEELMKMFGDGKARGKSTAKHTVSGIKTLKGLVSRRKAIYREYKGREYKAILTPGGSIKIRNKTFATPTAAARMIVQRKTVNGWRFWNIKNSNGEWVKFSDYKG